MPWLLALAAFLACLAFSAAPASAAFTHEYLPPPIIEIPAGSGAPSSGRIVEPQAIAVDSGDLYVADGGSAPGVGRLDKFDASSGAWLSQFEAVPALSFLRQGVAVGHSTGETEVYLGADKAGTGVGAIAVFGPGGNLQETWTGADTPAGGFGCFECNSGPGALAVDQSGNPLTAGLVYVAAPEQSAVDVFEAEAGGKEQYLTQITEREAGVPLSNVTGVAVDPQSGDLAVIDADGVDVFEATGAGEYALIDRLSETPAGPFRQITAVSVGGDGDIYVADSGPRTIEQFSAAGTYRGHLTGTPEAAFGTVNASLAVDPLSNDLYVGDRLEAAEFIDIFGPTVTVPDVLTGSASEVKPHGATINGTVNPVGLPVTECKFQWGETAAFGHTAPCKGEDPLVAIGSGTNPVPVEADLEGLQPDTTYHYRLQAANAEGTNRGEASQDREFTTTGPGIHSQSVSSVSAESATLEATIDPDGAPTTYYFQYGTTAQYGTSIPAPPGAAIGSGPGDVEVSRQIQGLSAAATYHYRVLARSEMAPGVFEEFEGPDREFTTQGALASLLPDGRPWELVSPPDKHGSTLEGIAIEGADIQAAANGSAITYAARGPLTTDPAGNRSLTNSQVLSRRGGSAWSSEEITTAHEEVAGLTGGFFSEYQIFSSDLSSAIVTPNGGTPLSPLATEKTPYRRQANGDYTPLVSPANVPAGVQFGGERTAPGQFSNSIAFIAATPDQSHLLLSSPQALTTEAEFVENSLPNVFEWSNGTLQLVSILPDEASTTHEGEVARVGRGNALVRNAISDDGSRVIFETTRNGTETHLYLRDIGLKQTVQLDATEAGLKESTPEPRFQTASSDGSRVFFLDSAKLTGDSTAREESPDLYLCEVTVAGEELGCRLKDLTIDANLGESANVQGVPGADRSGRFVYFVANGRLAQGAVRGDCTPAPEATQSCNLYERDTVAGETRLVAIVSASDARSWEAAQNGTDLNGLTSRVSPDGRFLAFMSQRPLSGFDNRDARGGRPDEEVFLYDSQADGGAGALRCASCAASGARPDGVLDPGGFPGMLIDRPGLWQGRWLAASIPGWTGIDTPHALYQSRYLSDSGRLFFNSATPLVPQDSNGTEDVYSYEPPGVGDCTTLSPTYGRRSAGCVNLISSGTSGEESAFLDASETGDDVFFLTASKLASQDVDRSLDVYDAHVCSAGAPCPPPPPPPLPACEGDACQLPAVAPDHPTPGTALLNGPGNLHPARRHHKKHHRKKHHKRAAAHNRGGSK